MLFSLPSTLLLLQRTPIICPRGQEPIHLRRHDSSVLCSLPSSIPELSVSLQSAYSDKGIAGVLDLCSERKITSIYEPKELVQAALQATSKGAASGILNALIGSCCLGGESGCSSDDAGGDVKEVERRIAQTALRILHEYDDGATSAVPVNAMAPATTPSRPSLALIPDVVTMSLAYTASFRSYPRIANKVISRAEYHPSRAPTQIIQQRDEQSTVSPGLEILLESKDFMIINKPSGLVLASEKKETSKPKSRQRMSEDSLCLEGILIEHCMTENNFIRLSSLNPDGSRGFVHRLDRGTSGCLVVAMTNQWHAQLLTQFFLRRVEKSYIALVYTNSVPLPRDGTMNTPIDGRPAVSTFQVLERYPGELVTKIRVTTKQGRKHQVRIHCSKCLNAPILLDPLYGGESIMYRLPKDSCAKRYRAQQRFCLHADSVYIPDLGIPKVEAQMPEWWNDIVKEILNLQE